MGRILFVTLTLLLSVSCKKDSFLDGVEEQNPNQAKTPSAAALPELGVVAPSITQPAPHKRYLECILVREDARSSHLLIYKEQNTEEEVFVIKTKNGAFEEESPFLGVEELNFSILRETDSSLSLFGAINQVQAIWKVPTDAPETFEDYPYDYDKEITIKVDANEGKIVMSLFSDDILSINNGQDIIVGDQLPKDTLYGNLRTCNRVRD